MREHMREHHTENYSPYQDRDSVNWKDAAKEAFGNLPGNAINLRGLRNREGLTQKELASSIGTNQANISKMERGIREISLKIAKRLSKIFDIDYRLFI